MIREIKHERFNRWHADLDSDSWAATPIRILVAGSSKALYLLGLLSMEVRPKSDRARALGKTSLNSISALDLI